MSCRSLQHGMDATHYPTRNLLATGCTQRHPMDEGRNKTAGHDTERHSTSQAARTLNPQVLGSNPRGRTRRDQHFLSWSGGFKPLSRARGRYPDSYGRTLIIVFPLRRSVEVRAATAPSRVAM